MIDRKEIESLYRKYRIGEVYGITFPQFFSDLSPVGIPGSKPESISDIEARVLKLVEVYNANQKPKVQ